MGSKIKGLTLGAVDYITKPFDRNEVVARVQRHLETRDTTFALKDLIHQNTGNGTAPAETLQIINQVFTRLLQDGEYLTACYARLERDTNRLNLVNAGHLPAVYIDARGDIQVLEAKGDILGAFEAVSFEPLSLTVPPGGRMFFYTDGLIEH